jgi:alkylation response protein AidB-like acyl-CoA dehydrogenase
MEAIETIARADGSAGWCAMIGLTSNVAAGYMSEEGAREVFADPTAPTAGIAAPTGVAVPSDGGVTVSGRWAFGSGITHSDWVWAGCLVMDNGAPRMTPTGPEIIHVWLPVSDVVIHDTWEPLFQMPPITLFVLQLASVSLGIARGALDELGDLAQEKTPTLYTDVLADMPAAQIAYAKAEAELASARSLLYGVADEVWQAVSSGQEAPLRQLVLGRLAATHAVETAARVAQAANSLAGGSSIYSSSSLQRHARDAEAITHHFTVTPHTWEEGGRVLLGREARAPIF